MMRGAALAALLLLTAAVSCAGAPPPPLSPPPAAPEPATVAPSWPTPPRYVVVSPMWVERTAEGLDRVVVQGRRVELRGAEVVAEGPAEPEVDGGARAPEWAHGSAARYVFWRGTQVWGSEDFMGALRPMGTLPAQASGAFEWLEGTGVAFQGGAKVVPAVGAASRRTGVPGLLGGVAADGRRAVALTALGHTLLTLDGGRSYRDVTADLGASPALVVRGDFIAAILGDGRTRLVNASGAIVDEESREPARGRPPSAAPDPFESATNERPLESAARDGLPLADGGVVIAEHGFVGRLDLATLRATSVAPLDPDLRDAACTPVRVASPGGGALLLACVGPQRAAIVDLEGAPRTERSFDLAGASSLDRFVVSDDQAIGYLGPCNGAPVHVPAPLIVPSGEPYNPSLERTSVFCVRAGRDEWVEHRLDPADAADVLAWIPRAGGGAVALLTRPGPFLPERERVSVRGALRIVRLARSEPPLSIPAYAFDAPENLKRALRALPDDTIEGWLPSGSGIATAVTIDAEGHARVHPAPPRTQQIIEAGRFALAVGEDDRLWETVDGGHCWTVAEPPLHARPTWQTRPSACSPTGCAMGSFVRLGWASACEGAPGGAVDAGPPVAQPTKPTRATPLLRLSCGPSGPPESRRSAETSSFGYGTHPHGGRTAIAHIGALGAAMIPWGTSQLPPSGDADLAWVTPLDVTGELRRVTVPLSKLASSSPHRSRDLRLGYLLTPAGGLQVFAVGRGPQCQAALLEHAGITRPLGACAEDDAVGVDLGGRVVVVSRLNDAFTVSAADAPTKAGGRGAAADASQSGALSSALHELRRTTVGGALQGIVLGAGARGGAPVVVALDANGDAALAPIDPEHGTVGVEERLHPLREATLGSAPACAPRGANRSEARVVLPLDGQISVDAAALGGVRGGTGTAVAVLRWSGERACLDAVEIPVHDDRYEESPGPYERSGVMRKIIARFDAGSTAPRALLLLVGGGSELRQRLSCTALSPGEAP